MSTLVFIAAVAVGAPEQEQVVVPPAPIYSLERRRAGATTLLHPELIEQDHGTDPDGPGGKPDESSD